MLPDPGYVLTHEAAQAVAGAVRFGRRFSREGMNNTPSPGMAYTASQTVAWPVKVTGSPVTVDPDTGDDSSLPGAVSLYPAVWLAPNAVGTGFDQKDAVWLLPFPGATLATNDVVLARLGGRREADGLAVYIAGGAPKAGGAGDVIGPDHAATGAFALFSDPSGRFIDVVPGLTFSRVYSQGVYTDSVDFRPDPRRALNLSTAVLHLAAPFNKTVKVSTVSVDTRVTEGVYGKNPVFDQHYRTDYFKDDHLVFAEEGWRFNGNDQNGFVYTEAVTTGAIAPCVIRYHSSTSRFQYWMDHFTSTGVAGITGTCTVKVGGVDKTLTFTEGIITGLA